MGGPVLKAHLAEVDKHGTWEWTKEQIEEGKKVRRKCWAGSGAYLVYIPEAGRPRPNIHMVVMWEAGTIASRWEPSDNHKLATDWEAC